MMWSCLTSFHPCLPPVDYSTAEQSSGWQIISECTRVMKCGCLQKSDLWWELEQACQEVQSASVGHPNDKVGDSAVG